MPEVSAVLKQCEGSSQATEIFLLLRNKVFLTWPRSHTLPVMLQQWQSSGEALVALDQLAEIVGLGVLVGPLLRRQLELCEIFVSWQLRSPQLNHADVTAQSSIPALSHFGTKTRPEDIWSHVISPASDCPVGPSSKKHTLYMLGLKYLSEKDLDSGAQDHEPPDVLNSPGRSMEVDEEVKN